MKSLIRKTLAPAALIAPRVSFAQFTNTNAAFLRIYDRVRFFLNLVIVFLFLAATAIFLYGIIGLATMVALWAFVNVIIDFFFQTGTDIRIPGPFEVPQQIF